MSSFIVIKLREVDRVTELTKEREEMSEETAPSVHLLIFIVLAFLAWQNLLVNVGHDT